MASVGADPCVCPEDCKQSHLSIKCDFSGNRLVLVNSTTDKLTDHGIFGHNAVIFNRVYLLE